MTSRQSIDDLIQAICQRSPALADNAWLPLTTRELEYIYESIGQHFIRERMTEKKVLDTLVKLEYIPGCPCSSGESFEGG